MRKAAGIILITLGVLSLRGLIIHVSVLVDIPAIIFSIVQVVFFITGGIFCLTRRYWRICLASASFAVFLGISMVVGLLLGWANESYTIWFGLLTAVISLIFISLTRKEWQEILDSVDGEVSDEGQSSFLPRKRQAIRMRKAAGIIMMAFGVAYLGLGISMIVRLIAHHLVFEWNTMNVYWAWIAVCILCVLFITAGVFCIRRKYWGLCVTSSVIFFICMLEASAYSLEGLAHIWSYSLARGLWVLFVALGLLTVIFVSLRRSEWKEISDSVDGKVSYDG
jgi:hypothetical protein